MTTEELGNKLVEWTDQYGWGKESLNNFANINATSYEEYNAIWELLQDMTVGD